MPRRFPGLLEWGVASRPFPGERASGELAKLYLRCTGGLPLAIAELTNLLADEGVLVRSAHGGWTATSRLDRVRLPETATLKEIILRRISRLPTSTRRLVTLASVLGHGFDAVLYCNLAHELLQIGDYHEALRYLDQGISRCHHLNNPRLLSVLLINRVICLTELDRAQEAMLDVSRVRSLPSGAQGRGTVAMSFETMAIAALRAAYGEGLPCVLITADRSSEVRAAAGQLDIAVVNKPLKPAVLRSMMARVKPLAPAAE